MRKYGSRWIALSMAGCLTAGMLFAGCGSDGSSSASSAGTESVTETPEPTPTETPTPTPTETPTPEPTPEPNKTIGEASADRAEGMVTLENGMGIEIFRFTMKETAGDENTADAFPENMLDEDDVFAVDEKRDVYFGAKPEADTENADAENADTEDAAAEQDTADPAGEEDKSQESAGEDESDKTYDILITLADETEYTLHAVPLSDMKEGKLLLDGEIAYVEYEAVSTGEKVSTLDAEKQLIEDAAAETQRKAEEEASQRAADQAAEQQHAAEEAAAQQAAAQQAAAQAAAEEAAKQAAEEEAAKQAAAEEAARKAAERAAAEQKAAEEAARKAAEQAAAQEAANQQSDAGCVGDDALVY